MESRSIKHVNSDSSSNNIKHRKRTYDYGGNGSTAASTSIIPEKKFISNNRDIASTSSQFKNNYNKYCSSSSSSSSSKNDNNNNNGSNSKISSNKRKRRATLDDDKDSDLEQHQSCKRQQLLTVNIEGSDSFYPGELQHINSIEKSSTISSSSYPSPVESIINEIDGISSSDCLSTGAEYDWGIPSPEEPTLVSSSLAGNSGSDSGSSSSYQLVEGKLIIRGDVTPHSEKRYKKSFIEFEQQHRNLTPSPDDRPCPLPSLSWANAADVWNLMCRKDERAAKERHSSLLEQHENLQPRMRAILLDWLIEVCEVYKLHRETYYLGADYLDRYLSKQKNVQKTYLQLIGITCLFVAAKVEEIYPPKIGEFAYVTDGACREEDILQHELLLLAALDWNITPITIMGWLGVYMQLNVSNRSPASFKNKSHSSHNDKNDNINNNNNNNNNNSKNSNNNNNNDKNDSKIFNLFKKSVHNANSNKDRNINNNLASTSIHRDHGISSLESSIENIDDSFIYPQFSGLEFAQTAQLLDLCTMDIEINDYSYSIIAAAAISHTFGRETALRVSGFEWNVLQPCSKWMEPFFQIIREESQHLYLLEQNEQVISKFGLGHICPNIVTDDSHIIQTHSTTITMFDRVQFRREQYKAARVGLINQEASPAVPSTFSHLCPEGLLTPPSSGRKPEIDDENIEPHLHKGKTL